MAQLGGSAVTQTPEMGRIGVRETVEDGAAQPETARRRFFGRTEGCQCFGDDSRRRHTKEIRTEREGRNLDLDIPETEKFRVPSLVTADTDERKNFRRGGPGRPPAACRPEDSTQGAAIRAEHVEEQIAVPVVSPVEDNAFDVEISHPVMLHQSRRPGRATAIAVGPLRIQPTSQGPLQMFQ